MFLSALGGDVSGEFGMEGLMKRVILKLLHGNGGWSEEFIERVVATVQKVSLPRLELNAVIHAKPFASVPRNPSIQFHDPFTKSSSPQTTLLYPISRNYHPRRVVL